MSEEHSNGAIGAAQPELTPLQTQYLAKIMAQLAMSRGVSKNYMTNEIFAEKSQNGPL